MKLFNLFLLIFTAVLIDPKESYSTPNSLQCESWLDSEWDQYLSESLLKNTSDYNSVGSKLKGLIATCPKAAAKQSIAACLDRIRGYYAQFVPVGPDTGRRFTNRMTDEQYLASQPKEAMELPKELSEAPHGLPKNWRYIAKQKGWKYVLFQSNTAQEPRLIMYLPGKKYDQLLVYYKLGDRTNNDPTTYDGLQMQSIEKSPDPKTNLPKYFFKSWTFGDSKSSLFGRFFGSSDHKPVVGNTGGNCVSCHISGPRAIVPPRVPAFSTELGGVQSVSQFNELIVHKGPLDYSPYYDSKYFPHNLKVGESNNCTQCHDGVDRNSLAYSITSDGSFYSENIERKVQVDQTMPKEDYIGISNQERALMAEVLAKDFSTKLKEWLTEKKCSPSNTSNPATDRKRTKEIPTNL